ncbi:glycosyltransferase family protein [Thalassobaculum sp. OXR-137]|uniref:glycosyltransferase family protein n=1 Tax=Thalassobaculum sp. OXR-137 TaxID=3100173 RepID=UPI002AC91CE5|nr:glycosyltransferase family protein [Thalassobaculum sp. OXR-137]WPZ34934.1 glycosyltransferase family protein [Thalassobaculum sp. OXR-137]
MTIAAVIQARMTSTRLPGKVLMPAAGRPMLAHQIDRVRRAASVDTVCIATTANAEDDPVVALAEVEGVAVFRGSEPDVLDRFVQAAESVGADIAVRLTGDCPLTDPALLDAVVGVFRDSEPPVDYATNSFPRTWPIGLDVEVVSMAALRIANEEADDTYDREHVTPFLYRQPERFRIASYTSPVNLGANRWTLDERSDYELLVRILEALTPDNPAFGWRDVIALLDAHPEWRTLNAGVAQKQRRYEDRIAGGST